VLFLVFQRFRGEISIAIDREFRASLFTPSLAALHRARRCLAVYNWAGSPGDFWGLFSCACSVNVGSLSHSIARLNPTAEACNLLSVKDLGILKKHCGKSPGGTFMSAGAPTELSDDELVREFRAHGDQTSFRQLFERHRRRVYSACRVFLQDASSAEDATQETFLRAYQNLDRFLAGNFVGWLMRIAKNVCIDQWRRHRHESDLAEDEMAGLADGKSFERSTLMRLALEKVLVEVSNLPEEQRRCLELKVAGYSYEETAALTGYSTAAVKSHLQNGRRMLWIAVRSLLSRHQ
jgi:RNA polymerase sigma factor (sigma-70 family)